MFLNRRCPLYTGLLVGLLLMASCVSGVIPPGSVPNSPQPAPPLSSPIPMVPLLSKPPELLDPAPSGTMVPLADNGPEVLNPSPNASRIPFKEKMTEVLTLVTNEADTTFHFKDYDLIEKSFDEVKPEEERTPTYLSIPAIGLDAPVEVVGWHTDTINGRPINVWDAPDHFAAGWLKSSAPFGKQGNTVLDGHHNIKGKVFKNLVNVQEGDIIILYAKSQERVYRVFQILILEEYGQPLEVRQANARYIESSEDERLTLVTCWPATGNTHRLIIVARPVQISPHFIPDQSENTLLGNNGMP